MSHINLDWQQLTLPLVLLANGTSIAAVIYSWFTRHKIDALI